MCPDPVPVTELLRKWKAGSEVDRKAALDSLTPIVYQELRRLASAYMRREDPSHTLQPTALLNEAYLKLVDQREEWQNRAHFFGVAAQVMRRILVDYARGKAAGKRGAGAAKLSLDDSLSGAISLDTGRSGELLALLSDTEPPILACSRRSAAPLPS